MWLVYFYSINAENVPRFPKKKKLRLKNLADFATSMSFAKYYLTTPW